MRRAWGAASAAPRGFQSVGTSALRTRGPALESPCVYNAGICGEIALWGNSLDSNLECGLWAECPPARSRFRGRALRAGYRPGERDRATPVARGFRALAMDDLWRRIQPAPGTPGTEEH